jgi:acyl-coenzyme A synthetase/AMP-(fatty) acid ligase
VEPLADAIAPLPDTPVPDEVEGYYMLYSSGTTGRPKVSFEDELPRLPSGKMLRRLLMDRYRPLPSS